MSSNQLPVDIVEGYLARFAQVAPRPALSQRPRPSKGLGVKRDVTLAVQLLANNEEHRFGVAHSPRDDGVKHINANEIQGALLPQKIPNGSTMNAMFKNEGLINKGQFGFR